MTDPAPLLRALADLRSPDNTACHGCGAVLVTQEDTVTPDDEHPHPAVWCDRCAAVRPREGRVDFPQAPIIRAILANLPPAMTCEAPRWTPWLHVHLTPILRIARGDCGYTARQRAAWKGNGIAGCYAGWQSEEERLAEPIFHYLPRPCATPSPAQAE